MDSHFKLPGVVLQELQHAPAIVIRQKNGLPVVATLDDMVRIARNADARKTGHEGAETRVRIIIC
jgi:hypothetical protein